MRRLLVVLVVSSCGPVPITELDAGPDDAGLDGGRALDAGTLDAGTVDAGTVDSGTVDAGTLDSGTVDAGTLDADAGMLDAGAPDAGTPDAGMLDDAGTLDAGTLDAGLPTDAGLEDAGPGDAGFSTDAAVDAGPPVPDSGLVDAGSVCGRCTTYGSVINVAPMPLPEISGLAASRKNPGVLYAHEDSGGPNAVTVLSTAGATLGSIVFMGATNVDWEDMAVGPCPAGWCIYVGEIGDNIAASVTPYAVYRVAEPTISAGSPLGMVPLLAERFELQYPNMAKYDAEALLVHPTSGDVYVVSKHQQLGTKSSAYKAAAPLSSTSANVMTRVAMLAVPDGFDLALTAGDIDPCGNTLLLRSYSALYQFVLPPNATSFDAIFTAPFTRVTVSPFPAGEPQGEAVCWNPGGGYFTASEVGQFMVPQQLHFVGCR